MKTYRFSLFLAVVALLIVSSRPAFGVAKEIIQLQAQVQALQDQMARMQQSFDERMGIMRSLIEQSTDKMNQISSGMGDVQKGLQSQQHDASGRTDQLSGQIQALNDSVDELKARLAKVSKQLEDMQAAQTNLPAASAAPQQPASQAPPPDVLYNNALRDYNSGKYDLAAQEFGDYLKFYSNTDLAGNAQFYLADMAFRQANYQEAIKGYDRVLEQYPGGNKSAAAQLKKGFALLELGRRSEGVKELESLITRYPKSLEAQQARDRLKKIGATPRTATSRRSPGE